MSNPFDIEINGTTYSIFPEGEDIYAVFKEGEDYLRIQKDTESHWLKLDPETEMPFFDNDEEVNVIGREIAAYKDE